MSEEEKKAIEELKEFLKGPCEICKYCSGAYKLNRENVKSLLNLIEKQQKEIEELKHDKFDYERMIDNSVDKTIIKDKIAELKKAINENKKIELRPIFALTKEEFERIAKCEINILQELLESEDK